MYMCVHKYSMRVSLTCPRVERALSTGKSII